MRLMIKSIIHTTASCPSILLALLLCCFLASEHGACFFIFYFYMLHLGSHYYLIASRPYEILFLF